MPGEFQISLRSVPLSEIQKYETPTRKIQYEEDVHTWRGTQSYQDLLIFLRRLNEASVGIKLPWDSEMPSSAILKMVNLLDTLDSWIDEIPPLDTPQRFGNLAFRTWGKRLEEEGNSLLAGLLPPEYRELIPRIMPYFQTSFGSFVRMDYGTGHETSFVLLLLCLTLARFFTPEVEEERELVFRVFLRYLRLCWRLQDTYRLEPAGSHGVWGLDDSHFLDIFSAVVNCEVQKIYQSDIPVSAVLYPPLPPTNLYFISIMRIHEVKHGPFHEHSSQLYSIATGVPNWGKVNSGLFKMYEAEVLGKRVVVQHIPLGGLLPWIDGVSQPHTTLPVNEITAMQAPWAQGIANHHGSRHPSLARFDTALPSWSSTTTPRPWPREFDHSTTSSMPPPKTLKRDQGKSPPRVPTP
ncbi:hypothetical protein D9757_014208 [Collybiopsis confluens]|uniref:Serine/threonine-protein phosphatase 2A activator n=1 Tax=Collybiopsis confluens TaxID=2823264 RepID=A0A8H5FR59_9AGAR|nr:hypothetical protein D9757_014208 [Collybiopsis confluens]